MLMTVNKLPVSQRGGGGKAKKEFMGSDQNEREAKGGEGERK